MQVPITLSPAQLIRDRAAAASFCGTDCVSIAAPVGQQKRDSRETPSIIQQQQSHRSPSWFQHKSLRFQARRQSYQRRFMTAEIRRPRWSRNVSRMGEGDLGGHAVNGNGGALGG